MPEVCGTPHLPSLGLTHLQKEGACSQVGALEITVLPMVASLTHPVHKRSPVPQYFTLLCSQIPTSLSTPGRFLRPD
jgi:hypothetical protein